MYLTIVTFVLALLFPAFTFAADQTQAPAPKAACCQMQGDHAGHGDGAGCCAKSGEQAACEHCKDGKCGECCKDGKCEGCCNDGGCKDGCCKDGCCSKEQRAGNDGASCAMKHAPKQ